jgi:hypothetical protein
MPVQPLTPDALSELTRFVAGDWATNSAAAQGAALVARFGVSKTAASKYYEEARAAYQTGFLSIATDADPKTRTPPADRTLAALWQAGRAAAGRQRRSRTQAIWVGAGLAVGAAVTLTLMAVR